MQTKNEEKIHPVNELKDQEIGDQLIGRSKRIIYAKTALQSLRETIFLLARVTGPIPSRDVLDKISSEVLEFIDQEKISIAIFLNELCKRKNAVFFANKFWLSIDDLLHGYAELEWINERRDKRIVYILFLSDITNDIPFDENPVIKKGSIIEKNKVKHLLHKAKPCINSKDISIKYILRKYEKSLKE